MWLPLAGAALLTVGFVLGLGLQRTADPLVRVVDDERVAPNALGIGRVEELLRYVEARYVDAVAPDSLVAATMATLLSGLDPYSAYVPPADVGAHFDRLAGSTEATGVELAVAGDSVVVLGVLPGSPAAAGGVLEGDRVLEIGESAVGGAGFDYAGLTEAFATLPGGPVRLVLFRRGVGVLPPVSLPRRRLALPTVGEGRLIEPDIAYVAVEQFADSTYFEFMRVLEDLVGARGARHLILDLRGNGGGYLREAVRLVGQFFPEAGTLLVYTEGAHAPRRDYTSSGRVLFPVDRVAVLVDGGSASASEVVAGALQDWDRGTVVGRPTFGKGLVQEAFDLKDGGVLHLTVSRYFTPAGRSIQRAYGSTAAEEPAYRTAAGRPVYGGRGIEPDVYVAVDPEAPRGEGRTGDPDIAAAVAAIRAGR